MAKKEWLYKLGARMEYGYAASMLAERLEAICEELHELTLIGDAMGSQQAFGPGGAPEVPPGQPGSKERKAADDALGQIKNVVGGMMGNVLCGVFPPESSVDIEVRRPCVLLQGHSGPHVYENADRPLPTIQRCKKFRDGSERRCVLNEGHEGPCDALAALKP